MRYFFNPKKSTYDSDMRDEESDLLIRRIFLHQKVSLNIWNRDKVPNIDGYIDIVNDDNLIEGKITVQAKTYPLANRGHMKYGIPAYILGYTERIKGEIVILLVVDATEEKIYWKYLDEEIISTCVQKGVQNSYIYHFKDDEVLTFDNVERTIQRWLKIYQAKIALIKDQETIVKEKIFDSAIAFDQIIAHFYNLNESYIDRKEVGTLYEWVKAELPEKGSNISLLVGDAGIGKSVVVKQLLTKLNEANIPTFAIKADMKGLAENPSSSDIDTLESLYTTFEYLLAYKNKAVLIIDQIDALSQNLSNDRYKLNSYLTLIRSFSKDVYKDVRIIISCRKFDLEYDPLLNTLKNNKVVELQKLTIADVEKIIYSLCGTQKASLLSSETIELLRTPQYLDIFCRVYINNPTNSNYHTPQSLYDELWKQIVFFVDKECTIKSEDIENILFQIAQKIQVNETLTPYWLSNANQQKTIAYLCTKGVVFCDDKRISFFHQSFYDYTLARYYTANSFSIVKEVERKHQGLFLRSTIKLIIDYQREHDEVLYKKELKALLFSNKIRLHLKLLIFQMVGSYHNLKPFEISFMMELALTNNQLFYEFINRSISIEWFHPIIGKIKDKIPLLTVDSKEYNSIARFLWQYVTCQTNDVFLLIEKISDEKTKTLIAERALWFTEDYSQELVIKWYQIFKRKNKHYDNVYLEKAINSNLQFACSEAKEILYEILSERKEYRSKNHNDDHFFEDICGKLVKEHPLVFYPVLKDAFLFGIDTSRYNNGNRVLDDNYMFRNTYSRHENYSKILEWIISILQDNICSNIEFVKQEVEIYVDNREISSFVMAMRIMNREPKLFIPIIIDILKNSKLVDELLNYGDEVYYFCELLKSSYRYLSQSQREWYQMYVYNFVSVIDFIPNKKHDIFTLLYPHLGKRKRKLIYTIPTEDLIVELAEEKKMLDRRFPYKCVNIKPDISMPMASFCGPLTSMVNYMNFTKEAWKKSFLKLKDESCYRKGKFFPFDINEHAKAFQKCVADKPTYFFRFVEELFDDLQIHFRYKLAGLTGLLEGGIPVEQLVYMHQHLRCTFSDGEYSYQFFEITQKMCNKESPYIDHIIPYLLPIIKSNYESIYNTSIENEVADLHGIDNLLTEGINIRQGRALRVLIDICKIKSRQKQIYTTLKSIYPTLNVELQLVVLHYLYVKEYYNEELFPQLLQVCLTAPISEYLLIQADAIHQYWHDSPEIVLPYVKSIIHHRRSQQLLSQILFWGNGYEKSKEYSKKYLEIILAEDFEEVVGQLIELSIKNISNSIYHDLSRSLLLRYASDKRKKIHDTYILFCNKLPIHEFLLFERLFANWTQTLDEDRIYSILEYLKKCSSTYPIECYHCIKCISKAYIEKYIFREEDIIELLLAIYKYLKDGDDIEILEEIMDTFDQLMLKCNFNMSKVLANIDRI